MTTENEMRDMAEREWQKDAEKAEAEIADLARLRAVLDDLPLEALAEHVARLRARAEAAEREAERLRHGVPIEGDLVCPDEVRSETAERERDDARAVAESRRALRDEALSRAEQSDADLTTERAAREKAEAACAAMRVFVADSAPHQCEHVSDGVTYLWWTCQTCREPHPDDGARIGHLHNCLWWRARGLLVAPDAGSALLADLTHLRAIEAASRELCDAEQGARRVRHESWLTRDEKAAYESLRAALAKGA